MGSQLGNGVGFALPRVRLMQDLTYRVRGDSCDVISGMRRRDPDHIIPYHTMEFRPQKKGLTEASPNFLNSMDYESQEKYQHS